MGLRSPKAQCASGKTPVLKLLPKITFHSFQNKCLKGDFFVYLKKIQWMGAARRHGRSDTPKIPSVFFRRGFHSLCRALASSLFKSNGHVPLGE